MCLCSVLHARPFITRLIDVEMHALLTRNTLWPIPLTLLRTQYPHIRIHGKGRTTRQICYRYARFYCTLTEILFETSVLDPTKSRNLAQLSERQLEGILKTLQFEIDTVKAQLHTRRLPSRILSRIFQLIVDSWSLTAEATNGGRSLSYDWLGIAHVCSHWRNVAIKTPKLWTHIILHKYKSIRYLLKRSQNEALFIYYCDDLFRQGRERQLEFFNLVRPHLPRVERVHVFFTSWAHTSMSFFKPLLCYKFPPLRYISLKGSSSSVNVGVELREWIKQGQCNPGILRAQGVHPNIIQSMVGTNLRYLSMTDPAFHDWKSFLSILQRVPRLESLICVGSTDDRPLNIPLSGIAKLPWLRYLNLKLGNLQILSDLLQHILYPNTATVGLRCSSIPSLHLDSTIARSQMDNIHGCLRRLVPKRSRMLAVDAGISNGLYDLIIRTTNFELCIGAIPTPQERSNLFCHLATSAVMKETRCLIFQPGIDDIWYQCWEQSQSYVAIRQNTPNLEQLALPSTYHLAPLLRPNIAYDQGIAAITNPFPALETLYVAAMEKKNSEDIQLLYEILRARRKGGNVLDHIYLAHTKNPSIYHPILKIVRRIHVLVP